MTFTKKPRDGFLLGKFMPPHQGHVFMCEFARQYCEHLTILVASLPDEPIPGKLRFQWMKEMFPDCTVVWTNTVLPQEPTGPEDTAFWDVWRAEVSYAMQESQGDNWSWPDVVFASEDYGHRLAKEVEARFVPVDIDRTARAISGTAIRNDPFGNWDYIPHVVRPYFTKRVTLFGPESTGKSTLAKQLGEHFRTVVVPEYGRTYTEAFGADVDATDLEHIVSGHIASVAAAKRQANKVLIEDTDPVMTAVWSDMLLKERNPWFSKFSDYGDLYLLTNVDIPWEDDGTRYFRNDEDRQRFFATCEAELKARGIRYVVVSGSREERLKTAIAAIDALLAE